MHAVRAVAVGLLVAWLVGVGQAEDWPVFQHNLQRNAKTTERLDAARLQRVWTSHLPGTPNPAWSGAARWDAYAGLRGLKSMRNYDPVYHLIAVGDKVWWGSSNDDGVHCVQLADGTKVWSRFTDGPVRMAPAYHHGRLYVGSDDGYAYCLDAERGDVIWRYSPRPDGRKIVNNGRLISSWPIRTGVMVSEGLAYFGASLLPWEPSYLCAVDAVTGQAEGTGAFRREVLGATMEGPMSLVPGRYLVSPQGRIAPRLFGIADGQPLKDLAGGGGSFVVLTKDSVFHGPGNKTGWLTASSLDSLETVASFKNGNAIVVAGDISFLLTDESLSATNYVSREELWSVDSDCPFSLLLAGDTLFVGGQDRVAAHDAKTGQRIWSHPVMGKAYSLVVANGHLLVSTDTGSLIAFSETRDDGKRNEPARPDEVPPGGAGTGLAGTDSSEPLLELPEVKDAHLRGRWAFQSPHLVGRRLRNLANDQTLDLTGRAPLEGAGRYQAWRVTTGSDPIVVTRDLAAAELPRESLTATAWVRVDEPTAEGAMVGCLQDNGDYERGWLLGYQDKKFCFGISASGDGNGLSYAVAPQDYAPGSWHHVAGVYDGRNAQLYVDGQLVATSDKESGPIAYPTKGALALGGYLDDNESYPVLGGLHEVRIYDRVLGADELQGQFDERAAVLKAIVPRIQEAHGDRLARGPILRFTSATSATLVYWTQEPCSTTLTLRGEGVSTNVITTPVGVKHEVALEGLHHQLTYGYTIEHGAEGHRVRTLEYECDMMMNYALPRLDLDWQLQAQKRSDGSSRGADWVLAEAGQGPGLAFCLGVTDGSFVERLIASSQWRVVVFDDDPSRVETLRRRLAEGGVYGTRVTVHAVESMDRLPVTGKVANLVVTGYAWRDEKLPETKSDVGQRYLEEAEVMRLLAPGGIALLARGTEACGRVVDRAGKPWPTAAAATDSEPEIRRVGPSIAGAGQWTHIYGAGDNSHFGGESLAGVRTAEELAVQWIGHPGARYQADRNGRKPSPLATGGRIFLQGLHRILALDQYNGTILWSLELPELDRYNMPRDCSNWCADDAHVYVAIHGECWKLSARDGQLLQVLSVNGAAPGTVSLEDASQEDRGASDEGGSESQVSGKDAPEGNLSAGQAFDWGFVARHDQLLLGSRVGRGASWGGYWGKEAWYDGTEGPVTDKVCSESLFALDAETGRSIWTYQRGAIVNSSITVAEGRVVFVESRGEQLPADRRRLGGDAFWSSLWMVALDSQTGELAWETPLQVEPGTVAFYASQGRGKVVLVSSAAVKYRIYVHDAATGQRSWETELGWGKGKADHGSHLSRPAIVGDKLFVRPAVYHLQTGEKLPLEIPVGGCGTYAATEQALFFRSGSGQDSAVWDQRAGQYTKWSRLRPDCWLSTIPAGGMLLSPEGGGGCSCGSWLETSLGFMPRKTLEEPANAAP